MKERTIFDNINDVFYTKTPWDEYTESDKKKFSPFMMNRWISMNLDYIDIINYLQPYTVGILQNREVYKLFQDLFPKIKFFTKYIKADKETDEKIPTALINELCDEFNWNKQEAIENLKFLSDAVLIDHFKQKGYSAADIKKQFKLK